MANRFPTRFRLALLLVALCTPLPAFAQPAKKPAALPTLIVFDFVCEKGVEKGSANLLTELVIDRVSSLNRYTVIGQKDLERLFQWEQNKQLKGCNDTSCLVQIAGAMGAGYYVEGSIGTLGEEFIVTVKLMDANKVSIISRATRRIAKNESLLADSVHKMVDGIFAAAGVKPADGPAPLKAGAPAASDLRPQFRLYGYISGGVAAAFFGTALYYGLRANSINDDLEKGGYTPAQTKAKIDDGNSSLTMETVGIAGGGAFAALCGYLLFEGFFGTDPKSVSVSTDGTGFLIQVGGRY